MSRAILGGLFDFLWRLTSTATSPHPVHSIGKPEDLHRRSYVLTAHKSGDANLLVHLINEYPAIQKRSSVNFIIMNTQVLSADAALVSGDIKRETQMDKIHG